MRTKWPPTLRPSQPTSAMSAVTAVSPPVGCHHLHPPLPFIIITQSKGWHSFYHPTEGRRLSPPRWLVTYRGRLLTHRQSPIQVLTETTRASVLIVTQHITAEPRHHPLAFISLLACILCSTEFGNIVRMWKLVSLGHYSVLILTLMTHGPICNIL